jgi:hypothetical protein
MTVVIVIAFAMAIATYQLGIFAIFGVSGRPVVPP